MAMRDNFPNHKVGDIIQFSLIPGVEMSYRITEVRGTFDIVVEPYDPPKTEIIVEMPFEHQHKMWDKVMELPWQEDKSSGGFFSGGWHFVPFGGENFEWFNKTHKSGGTPKPRRTIPFQPDFKEMEEYKDLMAAKIQFDLWMRDNNRNHRRRVQPSGDDSGVTSWEYENALTGPAIINCRCLAVKNLIVGDNMNQGSRHTVLDCG